jgi:hypothetical protein
MAAPQSLYNWHRKVLICVEARHSLCLGLLKQGLIDLCTISFDIQPGIKKIA